MTRLAFLSLLVFSPACVGSLLAGAPPSDGPFLSQDTKGWYVAGLDSQNAAKGALFAVVRPIPDTTGTKGTVVLRSLGSAQGNSVKVEVLCRDEESEIYRMRVAPISEHLGGVGRCLAGVEEIRGNTVVLGIGRADGVETGYQYELHSWREPQAKTFGRCSIPVGKVPDRTADCGLATPAPSSRLDVHALYAVLMNAENVWHRCHVTEERLDQARSQCGMSVAGARERAEIDRRKARAADRESPATNQQKQQLTDCARKVINAFDEMHDACSKRPNGW